VMLDLDRHDSAADRVLESVEAIAGRHRVGIEEEGYRPAAQGMSHVRRYGPVRAARIPETPSVTIATRDRPHRTVSAEVAARVFARSGVRDGRIV
jgi:hypothetical protein